jgi:hypothetical protein
MKPVTNVDKNVNDMVALGSTPESYLIVYLNGTPSFETLPFSIFEFKLENASGGGVPMHPSPAVA